MKMMTEIPEDDDCHIEEDVYARDGHELQGVQIRQHLMQQLLNIQ